MVTTVHDVLLEGGHANWGFRSDITSKLHGLGKAILSGVGQIAHETMLKCLNWTEESTGVAELPEEGGAADNFLEALDGP